VELAGARVVMAATRSDLEAADPSAIIHAVDDEEDNDMGFLPSDGDVSDEQWRCLRRLRAS
jgi:hypothetical protein